MAGVDSKAIGKSDPTEKLYLSYEVLESAKENAYKHRKEFEALLQATSGTTGVKRLAASFIIKFVHHFPDLVENALDKLFDLLEDEDSTVRLSTIKCLPDFFASCPDQASKVSDVLTQLLMSEDAVELAAVKRALIAALKKNCDATLTGVFLQLSQIEDLVKEKTTQFLTEVISNSEQSIFGEHNLENEKLLMEHIKQALFIAEGSVFTSLTGLLNKLSYCKQTQGVQDVIAMVTEVAGLDKDFQSDSPEDVDHFLECIRETIVWSQKGGNPSPIYSYIVSKVLPNMATLPEEPLHEILRLTTSLVTFDLSEEVLRDSSDQLLESLNVYLPEAVEELPQNENFQFSVVECLLYLLHHVCHKCSGVLSLETCNETLKSLRAKLTYFSRGCQLYQKQLTTDLAGKTDKELLQDENKMKVQAKKAISNIMAVIRDFFHNPPSCNTVMKLSFVRSNPFDTQTKLTPIYTGRPYLGPSPRPPGKGERKRITFDSKSRDPKKSKPLNSESPATSSGPGRFEITAISYYEPPRGTYSSKVTAIEKDWSKLDSGVPGGRGRGRGRGWRINRNGGRPAFYECTCLKTSVCSSSYV